MRDTTAGNAKIADSHLDPDAKRLSSYVFVFSIAFAVFVLGPPFLGFTFGPYPLMKVADILDLFTPLVLMPLYWLLFRLGKEYPPTFKENLAFVILVVFWVFGKGIHLTGNSIGHLTENMSGTDVFNLTNFYDEKLGHHLWHFGVVGLSGLLIYRQWRNPFPKRTGGMWGIIPAAVIYGFTFFAMVIEGATAPLGVTFAVLAFAFILIWARKDLARQPLVLLFLVGYGVSLLLFAIWGIWQGGFPEFSQVGFI
jgi:hypothetical protein